MKISYQKIMQFLKEENWEYEMIPISESHPIESIQINFPFPITGENGHLSLLLQTSQTVSAMLGEEFSLDALQFTYIFPEQIKEEAELDMFLLLNRLNQNFLLPGFGIDEKNKNAFFRHTLLLQNAYDKDHINNIIKIITNIIDTCRETIKDIALGEITLYEFINEEEATA